MSEAFDTLLSFIKEHPMTRASMQCRLGANEIYERVKGTEHRSRRARKDETDYKAQIASGPGHSDEARPGAEARHPPPGLRGRPRAGRLLRGARAELMTRRAVDDGPRQRHPRSPDRRGARRLRKVLDRIDAVTPTLKEARDELEFAAARLLGSVEPFQTRIVTRAIETQERAVAHIVQQANLVARKTVDEQTRAMQEAARKIFNDEVVPPLHRVAGELRQAKLRAQPAWEGWLTHAAAAVTAASCTADVPDATSCR